MSLSDPRGNSVGDQPTVKRTQHCTLCKNHDIKAEKKGHDCPYRECDCELCKLGRCSRKIMCHQQRVWRHKKQKLKRREDEQGSSDDGEKVQYCDRCRNHNLLEKKRNHACPFEKCQCKFCSLTFKRQIQMMYQQRVRRSHVVSKMDERRKHASADDPNNNDDGTQVEPLQMSRSPEEHMSNDQAMDMSVNGNRSRCGSVPPLQAMDSSSPLSKYEESPEGSCDSSSSRYSHDVMEFRNTTAYTARDYYEPVRPLMNRPRYTNVTDNESPGMIREIKNERLSPDVSDDYSVVDRSAFSAVESRRPEPHFVDRYNLGQKSTSREDGIKNAQRNFPSHISQHPFSLPLHQTPIVSPGRFNYGQNLSQGWILPSPNPYYLMGPNSYPWMEFQDRW